MGKMHIDCFTIEIGGTKHKDEDKYYLFTT